MAFEEPCDFLAINPWQFCPWSARGAGDKKHPVFDSQLQAELLEQKKHQELRDLVTTGAARPLRLDDAALVLDALKLTGETLNAVAWMRQGVS
eukprot:Skav208841  [mRNA]  locus=scaffold1193:200064:202422:+ [translate_table: standard]